MFWNPQKRVKKALFDVANILQAHCAAGVYNDRNVGLSFSYIALLNFVMSAPLDPRTTAVQFALLTSDGFTGEDHPHLVMSSSFHHA
jgi:hypothetical protein